MHLQLRFKHTYILLQENNNTNHGSSSKISTQNPTSQIKKKKITEKVLHITQHYQVHSTNISQHYSSTSQQNSTQNSGSITAKSQYQVLHIDPLKHP